MSGALGFNKSKNRSSSGFDQRVGNQDAMDSLYGSLGSLFGQTAGQSGGQQNQFGQQFSREAMNAQMPAWKQQMQGGAYAGMGVGNQLMNSLRDSQGAQSNMQFINQDIMGGAGNSSLDALKGSMNADAEKLKGQNLGQLDARAAAAGMSGGARAGVQTAQMQDNVDRGNQSAQAQLGYNAFDKDLDRKLNIAGQADANNFGRQQLQANMLQQQQNAMSQGLQYGQNMSQQGLAQQDQPWKQAGQYAQGIGGPTILGSGSSSSSGSGMGIGASGSAGGGGGGGK